MSELRKRVNGLVDNWLALGDVEDRPLEDEADFGNWAVEKVAAGDELSSFAEEAIDDLLAEVWARGAEWAKYRGPYLNVALDNPYRKEQSYD